MQKGGLFDLIAPKLHRKVVFCAKSVAFSYNRYKQIFGLFERDKQVKKQYL